MTARSVALDHYRDRERLVAYTATAAAAQWQSVPPQALAGSWPSEAARLAVVVSGAQRVAASAADPYLTSVLTEQGIDPTANGAVLASALSGRASDGRDLVTLLGRPAVAVAVVQSLTGDLRRATAAGLAVLDMIVRTQVADAGRVSDTIAIAVRRSAGGYTRMTAGRTTCARCAVLAGRYYRWSTGFLRHPRCDCIHVPTAEALADDLRMNPDALVRAGRVRLTKAQREAVSNGADLAQVVNAKRDVYTAGGKEFTRESTTRRGSSPTNLRLTPDQILVEAAGNRNEAIRLLRLHGYIR